MFKKILVTAVASICSLSAQASNSFTYDGHYEASEYDVSFSIDYDLGNGKKADGGTLAFASHDGKQYMYIAHPLGFKDLSYGKDDKYLVGWDGSKQDNAEKAMKSEYFTLSFDTPNGIETFKFDPRIPGMSDSDNRKGVEENKINGIKFDLENGSNPSQVSETINGLDMTFLSTLNYNSSLLNEGDFFGSLGDFYKESPETVDCGDESSSAASCYQIDNNVARNSNVQDWDFNFGIEVEITSGNLFGDGFDIMSLLPEHFGVNQDKDTPEAGIGDVLVSLDDLHASDPKIRCSETGIAGDKTPCDVIISEKPPENPSTDIPEPSALTLIALGLVGIGYRRMKKA
ncbi:PEP-CTERM sorting domain-containing protein [uncultured Paraglaciecola sp.]|uniref:PEP-CTERM sorting domain-containing protein n=1 Tax=uncultured Paraglaciecola sp. TaxID=1765024 RepID=UPI00262136FC|nr:PEP-CTERM sorting domain-containing protein [uncultured Paraglaciecola sp.]